jgi:hypothetical protein
MKQNRPPSRSIRRALAFAVILFIAVITNPIAVNTQDSPFVVPQPMCYAPPSPATDTWPRAATDSLSSNAGVPFTFPGTALTANDTAAVTVRSVGPASGAGGTITGTGPFTFTPAPGFVGEDVFPYEIVDAASRTTMGLVKISVTTSNATSTVPGVVGLLQAAAVSLITGADLLATVATSNSPSAAIGTVISQSPPGGNTVATGSSVALIVSLGSLVPNLVGSAQASAAAAITTAGLTVGPATGVNSAAPVDSIISQSLMAGASVAPGTAMSFVYSLGPLVGPPPPPPPPDPVGGLVLALGFEELSGTAVTDSSALPTNGTIRGAVRVAAGQIGRALSFDGVDDWVTVADTAASKIDLTNGLTVEAWVKPTAMAGWETVVMKERGAFGTGFLSYALYAHDGAPQAGTFAGPAAYLRMAPALSTTDQGVREASHTALPLNAWTHIATTYDGAAMRFYINGQLVATRSQTGNIAVGNQPLRIGGNNVSGEFFKGLIDEVRIYNRPLSASEITADMTTPVVP